VKDDLFWKQRAKTFWHCDGDLNTRYFHAVATSRRKINKIIQLEDAHGVVCNSSEGLKSIARDYFNELFQQQVGDRDVVINAISRSILDDDNESLTAPFLVEEFHDAIFSMESDKCPGPDGFNPGFYKHFWDICGQELFDAGCSWLELGVFPTNLNSTHITLFLKGDSSSFYERLETYRLMQCIV
jgi:hypothetical protein